VKEFGNGFVFPDQSYRFFHLPKTLSSREGATMFRHSYVFRRESICKKLL